ncbi:uncharacterized protein K444DRAFT_307779 [Hyaloscypha bicolor E]|uniref:Uncharacterized protein n=1 Tax=Hyaloscypha bicolor E TaxID=1095630 RepID=A0A2J6TMJ6_9HELO|nr:uncharacterized protein K444DRAFT_307779 [Hyaloscypha bicolor E]PMD64239.1 hypothetical protein K444DRAFT_307779 [Hyaloscypha bicolor E]
MALITLIPLGGVHSLVAVDGGESTVERCGHKKTSLRSHRSSPLCLPSNSLYPATSFSSLADSLCLLKSIAYLQSFSRVKSPAETFTCIVAEAPCTRSRLNHASRSQPLYLLSNLLID